MTVSMRGAVAVLALWLAAAGCDGCKACEQAPEPDTTLKPLVVKPRSERSTDLRAVFLLIIPEYRGVNVTGGRVALKRTMSGATDWEQLARDTLAFNHFTAAEDGGTSGVRGPLKLALVEPGVMELSLEVTWDVVESVFQSAAPMSTLTMGQYFPREGVVTQQEAFDLDATWEAESVGRGAFVAWQVVNLLTQSGQWRGKLPEGFEQGWSPDGAPGRVPEKFEVTLTGEVDGAVVTVKRDGKHCSLHYHLQTIAPP